MKKNNLFKAIGFVILLYICLSWLIPIIYGITGTKGDVSNQIGFVSIVSVLTSTFSGFGNVVLFVLLVGGFYGVLKATGAYDKMMNSIVSHKKAIVGSNLCFYALLLTTVVGFILASFTGIATWLIVLISFIILAILVACALVVTVIYGEKTCLSLATIMVTMAVIASFTGLDLGLLIVFPFLIGLVGKMGYDKIVALSATVGATIVGMYGSLYSNTMYGLNAQVLTATKLGTGIVAKIILLVVGVGLLVALTLAYTKVNKKAVKLDAKKETNAKVIKEKKTPAKKASTKKPAAKKTSVKKEESSAVKSTGKKRKEKGALPAFITVGVLFLIFILGTTAWASMFGADSSIFDSAHKAWTGFTIGGFEILNKLFGGIDAFGSWADPNRFGTYSMLLLFAMAVIALFYSNSVKESFDGFVEGLKSFVVPTIITILVCSVFVFVYYNPVINPVTSLLITATDGFNVALASLYTLINSFFYVDYYYLAASTLVQLAQVYTDANVQSVLSVMYVSLYSVVMLVAPTSLILMLGLAISETKYTDWIKFIWIFALILLLVAFVVLMTMAGLIPLWAGIIIGVVVVAILVAIYAAINHLI